MKPAHGLPLRLYNAQVLCIRDRSVRIACGKAWLTDAHGKDLILETGQCYRIAGVAVIEAIGATDLVLERARASSPNDVLMVS